MEFKIVEEKQWEEIKDIYFEAFPKRERKPYYLFASSFGKKEKSNPYDCCRGRTAFRICCFNPVSKYDDG